MKIRYLIGLALASTIVLGGASVARAQIAVSVGNPWTAPGIVAGTPYAYSAPGTYVYSRGYVGVAGAPLGGYYNPGYAWPRYGYGVAAPRYYAPVSPYVYRGRGFRGRRYYYGW